MKSPAMYMPYPASRVNSSPLSFSSQAVRSVKTGGGEPGGSKTPEQALAAIIWGGQSGAYYNQFTGDLFQQFQDVTQRGGSVTVGRGCYGQYSQISRRHFSLSRNDQNKLLLTDAQSSNGTFLLEEAGFFRRLAPGESVELKIGHWIGFSLAGPFFGLDENSLPKESERLSMIFSSGSGNPIRLTNALKWSQALADRSVAALNNEENSWWIGTDFQFGFTPGGGVKPRHLCLVKRIQPSGIIKLLVKPFEPGVSLNGTLLVANTFYPLQSGDRLTIGADQQAQLTVSPAWFQIDPLSLDLASILDNPKKQVSAAKALLVLSPGTPLPSVEALRAIATTRMQVIGDREDLPDSQIERLQALVEKALTVLLSRIEKTSHQQKLARAREVLGLSEEGALSADEITKACLKQRSEIIAAAEVAKTKHSPEKIRETLERLFTAVENAEGMLLLEVNKTKL